MRATLERLAAVVGELTGRGASATRPAGLNAWRAQDWHAVLLDLPLDERAYADRFQVAREREIEELWRWWPGRADVGSLEPRAAGFLGFYLLTLVAMHCSDRMRFHGDAPAEVVVAGTTAENLSRALVADPDVRQAIAALHDPSASRGAAPSAETVAEWAALDVTSLKFYRHGTTSIILTGRVAAPSRGRTAAFALKCVIHPYLSIPAIVSATRGYLAEHGRLDREESSPAVPVWASHESWILMDLVRGRTLGEHLAHRAAQRPAPPAREILRPVDTAALRELGGALLSALADLERDGQRHDDLTPSNIIVQVEEPGRLRLRFVDLGVNHLHTRSITGQVQGDGAYTAPEVRRDGVGHPRADLYSLGALLITIAGIPHSADGTVPDQFYVASVGLARLLEDLTDADPRRRLLVVPVDPAAERFEQLGRVFGDEVAILEQDGRDRPDGWLQRLFTLVGIVTVALVVQACLWFARDANARARAAGLTSVPRGEIATLERLAAWQPTVAIYLIPIVVIGTLLSLGLVHDELVYACFVSLINVGIFYLKSAGTDAPYIRAGLSRAVLAAERLEHLERKRV